MQITINAGPIRFKRIKRFNRFYFSSRPDPVFEMFSRFAGSSLQKQNNTQVLRRTTYEYKRNNSRNCFASFCCLFSPFCFPHLWILLEQKMDGKGALYCVALTIDLGSSCCRCAPPVMLSQKELYKALGVHGPEFHLNVFKVPAFLLLAAVPDRICLTLSPQLKSISKWVHKEQKNLKFINENLYSPASV